MTQVILKKIKKYSFISFLTVFTSFNFNLSAQEICNNGIDDDLNGLTDCADPVCSSFVDCSNAFPCSNDLYQVIGGVLKIFDPALSKYEIVGDSEMGSYNGAGYNVQDGYIYAIKQISGVEHIIKITNNGVAIDYGEVLNWSGATYRADIDDNGNWYSYNSGANPTLLKIDLDVFPLTMQSIPLTNLSSSNIPGVADLTFNAKTGKLYGFGSGNKLIALDIINYTADIIADYDGTGSYGAAWSDIYGNSFFSNNSTGYIYMISFDTENNPTELKHLAYGEITSNNDGINCMLSVSPLETSCDDNIDNDNDGFTDEGDIYCLEVPDFTELTNDPFVNEAKNTWGITVLDYNNDGFDDVYVPNYTANEKSDLFINNGNGNFSKSVDNDLVDNLASSVAASAADFNNDGYIDIAVANNNGNPSFSYKNAATIFSNTNDQIFSNVDGYSHSINYVDYDNDGFVDIFISDYFETKFNLLYHNNGDGTFERITEGAIVNDAIPSIGSTWSDVNNDGFVDLFVPVRNGSNVLYKNNGNRSFTKVLFNDDANSVGCSFGDIDNDGDMDLFVANASNQNNFLYINDGEGNFVIANNSVVNTGGGDSHGSSFGDYNNDGWLDLYVTNDNNGVKFFYLNDGTGDFNRALISSIVAPTIGNSFGVANADFNRDGNLDLAIANHSNEKNKIFLNSGNGNNYLNIRLKGTNSNTSAIGAKIFITSIINGEEITQMREVSGQTGGGSGSQNSLAQHFGLLDATLINKVEIKWPSGYQQILTNVTANQFLFITEDNGSLISGHIYHDENNDCIMQENENGIANKIVTINPGPLYTITDSNGYYKIYVKQGNFTLSQKSDPNFNNTCQGNNFNYNVNASGIGNTYTGNDFANKAIQTLPDLLTDIGVSALKRGAKNTLSVSYANYGVTAATNVQLTLTIPSDINIVNSSLDYTNNNNIYVWNLGTLDVNENGSITLENFVPNSLILGEDKTFSINITSTENDVNLINNSSSKTEKIVGSVDPNDILVSPIGYGPMHQIAIDETLNYTIRFQNVGNYEAKTVIVIDTLPEELDLTTFIQGSSSHQYKLEIYDSGIVKWTFNNINLPDSINNEMASHGFIQFSIKPNENLENSSRILNKAAIQFDYSQFIITNEVFNSIGNFEDNFDFDEKLFLYPNPAKEFINVFFQESSSAGNSKLIKSFVENNSLQIYNVKGKQVYTENTTLVNNAIQIDISNFSNGMYLVIFNHNDKKIVSKFIKE